MDIFWAYSGIDTSHRHILYQMSYEHITNTTTLLLVQICLWFGMVWYNSSNFLSLCICLFVSFGLTFSVSHSLSLSLFPVLISFLEWFISPELRIVSSMLYQMVWILAMTLWLSFKWPRGLTVLPSVLCKSKTIDRASGGIWAQKGDAPTCYHPCSSRVLSFPYRIVHSLWWYPYKTFVSVLTNKQLNSLLCVRLAERKNPPF